MIHFVLPAASEWTLREYLSRWGAGVADRFRILHYESLADRISFDRGTYVLSTLQLAPGPQRLLEEWHGRLAAADGVRFLNHPTRTLRRYALLEELARRGLNEFRAARLTEDVAALRYPIFLRSEWEHTGALSPLLRSPAEVEGAIGRAVWQGHRWEELLAVEFCDTADANGFYRKYSAYIVGDRILSRSMEYGRSWMLKHARSEFAEPMLLEERAYVFGNPHEKELREIFAIAGVQYGRIDYAVKDGRIQTWEINLHPTIGRGQREHRSVPEELEPIRLVGKEHFHRGFEAAWKEVDLPSDAGPSIPVVLDASIVSAARSGGPRRGRRLRLLRAALRPFRPILETVGRPLLPLVARLAARGSSRSPATPR
jgi:hypothetical protein